MNAQMKQSGQQENLTTDRSLIGTKELNYLTDFMSWELLAMKKCNEAATGVMDKQISDIIQKVGRRHQEHYNSLLQHLQ